jgi:dTDP-4-dehydrorhamnose reductase
MSRIMITGAEGRLGGQVARVLQAQGVHTIHATTHVELDVTKFNAVRQMVNDIKPDVVIHCAAWTDVDGCARDPERAIQVNGLGAGNVAVASANIGAATMYVSTNEVFDGQKPNSAYREYDGCAPANPYGYSKFVGEQEVMRLNPKHYIVRTAWLFAHGGKNFMQSMINAARAGKNLRVVTDEIGNPTYTNDLADAMLQLIETGRFGTYHLVNAGATSRWAFARYILDRAGFVETPIARISRTDWPRASTPPAYCALSNTSAAHLGVTLRPWQEAVDAFLTAEGLMA